MADHHSLTIGTRGSPLALAQAYETRDRLIKAHGIEEEAIEIRVIKTTGDQIQDKALRSFGGKGLFTKEIEEALIEGKIDLAVHSMKDVQTELPDGLVIAATLARGDVRDGFISPHAASIDLLESGSRVGTASLRRQAQLKYMRPDLEVVTFRGSVQTRLEKLNAGDVQATFLAVAGLNRLGLSDKITKKMSVDDMLPAVAQGAIGIECRLGDHRIEGLLEALNDRDTGLQVSAERAFLQQLDGSCRTPIAGLCTLGETTLAFRGQILAPDGSQAFSRALKGPIDQGEALGIEVAKILMDEAGPEFMAALVH